MSPAPRPVAAAFALGLALGAAAGSWGQRAVFRRMMRHGPDHRRMLERLSRDLGLDEKQKVGVAAVMESRMAEVDKVKAETFARLESLRAATDAELAKILTPEQAAKFRETRRRRPLRLNWDAPPPPP